MAFLTVGICFAVFISQQEATVPRSPRIVQAEEQLVQPRPQEKRPDRRVQTIRQFASEGFHQQTFPFALVVNAVSGKNVLPLDLQNPIHQEVKEEIVKACDEVRRHLSAEDSPVRALTRINEASRYFEDALITELSARPSLNCSVPQTAEGQLQRSGYPDLLLQHIASGTYFYLDPKLIREGSQESSLRSFYYTPRQKTSKIRFDAVHLVLGIEHDGAVGEWQFTQTRLGDLSDLDLQLKTEFHASNRDLYKEEDSAHPQN